VKRTYIYSDILDTHRINHNIKIQIEIHLLFSFIHFSFLLFKHITMQSKNVKDYFALFNIVLSSFIFYYFFFPLFILSMETVSFVILLAMWFYWKLIIWFSLENVSAKIKLLNSIASPRNVTE